MRQHPCAHCRGLTRLLLAIALASLQFAGAVPAAAQAELHASEAAVKAAYVVRFLQFVEWPPAALPAAASGPSAAGQRPAPLVIGVLASDHMARQIAAVASGRRVAGRELLVRRLQPADTADGLDVLFVGQTWRRTRLAESIQARPVLIISDQGLDDLTMLNFVPVDGRIRFEASAAAAERAGIRLGARLLAIAEKVVK
jgi:mRNA-degrading endonuclease toxin of MazEF toxin-antitoxin module